MNKIAINFKYETYEECDIEGAETFYINDMYAKKYLKLINDVYDDDFDDTCFCAKIIMNKDCLTGILSIFYAKGKHKEGDFLIQLIDEIGDLKIFNIERICM